MKSTTMILTSAIALFALPLHAAVIVGDVIGTTEADIRTALESSGYAVESIEMEDDEIEVETRFDRKAFEIELSASTGAVLEIEAEDKDDDDD